MATDQPPRQPLSNKLTGKNPSKIIGSSLSEALKVSGESKQQPDKSRWMTSYVAAGFPIFPVSDNKIPLSKGWQNTKPDITYDLADYPFGYGVVLRDTDFVLDYDPRRDPAGDQLTRLWQQIGAGRQETFIVLSGGGGNHIYFTKPADFKAKSTVPGFPAIEIKSAGRYVVGPGSPHPSGNVYEAIRHDPKTILPAPEALLLFCQATDIEINAQQGDIEIDDEMTRLRFTKYCQAHADKSAFVIACEGKNYGLPLDRVVEIMDEHHKPPKPNSLDEIRTKVEHAWLYSKGKQGSQHPSADWGMADTVTVDGKLRPIKWDMTEPPAVKYKETLNNVMNLFRIEKYNKELRGLLRYNVFGDRVEYSRLAPWHNEHTTTTLWGDDEAIRLKDWLGSYALLTAPVGILHEAAVITSRDNSFHPIQEWSARLVWDGVPRIDRMLVDYCGAGDSDFVREFTKNTMIGLMARIWTPGCKHDEMLILEGKTDIGKSTFIEVLGGEWYKDAKIDLSSATAERDTIARMQNGWILEASELEFFKKTDVSALKRFLSIKVDHTRLAYRRDATAVPRYNLFIGTVNPSPEGYFRDPTGNRRFWPVWCNQIDMPAATRDRDQLFAEALHRFRNGEPHHITDERIKALARNEQSKRMETDSWSGTVQQWLVNQPPDAALSTDAIAYQVLNLSPKQFTQNDRRRVAQLMRDLGYVNETWRQIGKERVRIWTKED